MGWKFVICQNPHTEALADLGKRASDFAGSHNAGCLAVQIKSGKTGKAEIKITGADISLIGMPVDCEQQCHCMLCHSVR